MYSVIRYFCFNIDKSYHNKTKDLSLKIQFWFKNDNDYFLIVGRKLSEIIGRINHYVNKYPNGVLCPVNVFNIKDNNIELKRVVGEKLLSNDILSDNKLLDNWINKILLDNTILEYLNK